MRPPALPLAPALFLLLVGCAGAPDPTTPSAVPRENDATVDARCAGPERPFAPAACARATPEPDGQDATDFEELRICRLALFHRHRPAIALRLMASYEELHSVKRRSLWEAVRREVLLWLDPEQRAAAGARGAHRAQGRHRSSHPNNQAEKNERDERRE